MTPAEKGQGPKNKKRKGAQGTAVSVLEEASKRALFQCSYCHDDISNTVRIKCAICTNFTLCLPCFAAGVQQFPHRCEHDYHVIDNLAFPTYTPDWGADEEMLLLEGVDMYGLGNWAAVATHVATQDSTGCQQHYHQVYLQPHMFPEPYQLPSLAHIDAGQVARERLAQRKAAARQQIMDAAAASAKSTHGKLSGKTPGRTPAKGASGLTAPQTLKFPDKTLPGATIKGVLLPGGALEASAAGAAVAGAQGASAPHPKAEAAGETGAKGQRSAGSAGGQDSSHAAREVGERGLPQAAGKAPAEQALPTKGPAKPSKKPADASSNRVIKVNGALLDMTGFHTLRNEFEPEHDNAAENSMAELEFREDDTEAERADKLRLVQVYNLRLDERVARKAHIQARDLLNLRHYQAAEKKWNAVEQTVHVRARAFHRYLPGNESEVLAAGLLQESRLRARILELVAARTAGASTLAEAEDLIAQDALQPAQPHSSMPAGPDGGTQARQGPAGQAAYAQSLAAAHIEGSGVGVWLGPSEAAVEAASASGMLAARQVHRGVALELQHLPGLQSLSSRERELCATARILPAHYLAIKAALLTGQGPPSSSSMARSLDQGRMNLVVDLLQGCGWLPAHSQAQRSFPEASRGTSPVSSAPSESAAQAQQRSQNGDHAPSTLTGPLQGAEGPGEELGPLPSPAQLRGEHQPGQAAGSLALAPTAGLAERSGSGEQTGQSNWGDSGAGARTAERSQPAASAEVQGLQSQGAGLGSLADEADAGWVMTEEIMDAFEKDVPLQPG